MSTNIRVDVTLQRLQEQSRQATEQNRRQRQEREDALQQSGLTPAGNQNAADDPAAQASAAARQSSRGTDPSRAKGESPFDERRPAAQRLGNPSIVGVQYVVDYDLAPSGVRKITVGVPGLQFKAEHVFSEYPTTAANTNLDLPADVYVPAGGVNPGLATVGGVVPPAVFQSTGLTINYYPFSDERLYDLSAPLCLPLNAQATIFVWDYHLAKHQVILARETERASQAVDARQDELGRTIYNRLNDYTNDFTYNNDDFKVARSTLCFLVTPKGVKPIATPAAFLNALYSRRPTASRTGSIDVLQKITYQTKDTVLFWGSLVNTEVTIPEQRTYQSVAGFQASKWNQTYTGPGMGLAIQFGIGSLLDNTHGTASRDYFSGSVYQWLTKPMDLSKEESLDYSHVRALISDFPGRYITSVAGFPSDPPPTYRPDQQNFGIAKKAPLKYTGTPMSYEDFIWTSQYKFPANGAPPSQLAYCWNWDDEQYCRRQLLALGFKSSDFVL